MKIDKKFLTGILTGIMLVLSINLVFKTFTKDTGQKKLSEIQKIIDDNFSGEIDNEKLKDYMYSGYVAGLEDRYSYYMNKDVFNEFLKQSDGAYVGIGVSTKIDEKDGRLKIISIYDGSNAPQAGIQIGDKIVKIGATRVDQNNYAEAIKLLQGNADTSVKVTIYRESSNETFETSIIRKNINVPTVSGKMLENEIGYIKIEEFDRVTYDQYVNTLNNLKSQGMKRLIIDLRNNPGGLLNTVVKITDSLVPKGIITYIEDKYGNKSYEYSDENYLAMPLVVLVNENSASASEVLSGAIKDFGVGKLVGEKTFGKGVVQNTFKLSDGSGVKITMAKYYTPNGICIHGKGIEPDYKIKGISSENLSSLPFNEDIQLQKGIEIVKSL